MLRFASPPWIAALDEALRGVAVSGPPARVRFEFTDDGDPVATRRYDLVLGDGLRAEVPTPEHEPTVTISQPLDVARRVAAGTLAAPRAMLDGSIRIAGRVTDLVAWRAALDAADAATAALRADTAWT
jgi:hypothetical protein